MIDKKCYNNKEDNIMIFSKSILAYKDGFITLNNLSKSFEENLERILNSKNYNQEDIDYALYLLIEHYTTNVHTLEEIEKITSSFKEITPLIKNPTYNDLLKDLILDVIDNYFIIPKNLKIFARNEVYETKKIKGGHTHTLIKRIEAKPSSISTLFSKKVLGFIKEVAKNQDSKLNISITREGLTTIISQEKKHLRQIPVCPGLEEIFNIYKNLRALHSEINLKENTIKIFTQKNKYIILPFAIEQ